MSGGRCVLCVRRQEEGVVGRKNGKKKLVVFAIERNGKGVSRMYGKVIKQSCSKELGEFMKTRGVLINASPVVRLVMHLDVSREQLADVVKHWQAFLQR